MSTDDDRAKLAIVAFRACESRENATVADIVDDIIAAGWRPPARITYGADDEEFCPVCAAGMESAEHRERCGDGSGTSDEH